METGDERDAPIHPNNPSQSSSYGPEREMDGALGVLGGQPDVSPSGLSDNNNDTPEPKVKIYFIRARHASFLTRFRVLFPVSRQE